MTEPRVIALIGEYGDLIAACNTQRVALGITYDTLDAVAGVPSGYSAKVLSQVDALGRPLKHFGQYSWSIVCALGIRLTAHEDREALAKLHSRLERRKQAKPMLPAGSIPERITPLSSQHLNSERTRKLSPAQRRAIATNAAAVRWERVKAVARGDNPPQSCPGAAKP